MLGSFFVAGKRQKSSAPFPREFFARSDRVWACDRNTEQVRLGGKWREARNEYWIMTTAVQQYLQGIKSGLQVIIDQLEVSFFPY